MSQSVMSYVLLWDVSDMSDINDTISAYSQAVAPQPFPKDKEESLKIDRRCRLRAPLIWPSAYADLSPVTPRLYYPSESNSP